MHFSYLKTVKEISITRQYIYYAVAYGLSTLIIPFGVQYLVNRLALSGLIFNMLVFFLILGVGLILAQVIRYSQIILSEFLQRLIYRKEVRRWNQLRDVTYSHYFFEVHSLLKSFSKSFTHFVELGLIVIFGLSSMLLFHPFFIVPSLVVVLTIYLMIKSSKAAIYTSIKESDTKYALYNELASGKEVQDSVIESYLIARNNHFKFVRKNSFYISIVVVGIQLLVLGIGCYLIQVNQLSVGQLVSAEIIISGILISLLKLPQTLEDVYDFETGHYKIRYALGERSHGKN
jgi:hypothetical protein